MSLKGECLKTTRKNPLFVSFVKENSRLTVLLWNLIKNQWHEKAIRVTGKFPGDKVPRTLNKTPGCPILCKVNLGKRFADRGFVLPLNQIVTERKGTEMGKGLIVPNRPMEALKTKG